MVMEKYNDYGLGFYCTEDIDMAKEWGVNYKFDRLTFIKAEIASNYDWFEKKTIEINKLLGIF